MAHGPRYARSVRHDLGPNIFPSGPPTQSISTYYWASPAAGAPLSPLYICVPVSSQFKLDLEPEGSIQAKQNPCIIIGFSKGWLEPIVLAEIVLKVARPVKAP